MSAISIKDITKFNNKKPKYENFIINQGLVTREYLENQYGIKLADGYDYKINLGGESFVINTASEGGKSYELD